MSFERTTYNPSATDNSGLSAGLQHISRPAVGGDDTPRYSTSTDDLLRAATEVGRKDASLLKTNPAIPALGAPPPVSSAERS
ncbi:hypothetical protein EXIGLDRAFT_715766 [Exidia glandulosa HHB12029]|uniref:Uncharacterized protein n=1 Tax=Exidia glandulosa HHB12029 TaxID=1314781 RepID=A0A165QJ39_EXIGL|nr:hypothetical protein EXIGLDRAFT_715766 [Exidia glandulosa HHB12029]